MSDRDDEDERGLEGHLMRERGEDEREARRGRGRNGAGRGVPLSMASALSDTYVTALERGASMFGNNLRLLQDETMRFVTQRLEHDAYTMEEMGRAKNFLALFAIQQKWLNETATAYSQEFMRLSRLTANVTEEGMSIGRESGERMRGAGDEFQEEVREQGRSAAGSMQQH